MDVSTLNIQQLVLAATDHFDEVALEIFRYQAENNLIYKDYLAALQVAPLTINHVLEIPFLPISFFKSHHVMSGNWIAENTFTSSGTTGDQTSKHPVKNTNDYILHCREIFESQFGDLTEYCILGLLPSYLERSGSGLISMVEGFMGISDHPLNGYFLYDHQNLFNRLTQLENQAQKTLLIGVTFGLLDFATAFRLPLKHTIVMETGGMKGRGRELTREEVHNILKMSFDLSAIHSEYGMTELSSQAYSDGHGIYRPSRGMRVLVRETTDPLSCHTQGAGGLNIVDIANVHTCSFIATEDLGQVHSDGRFEVLGRFDQSEARGCNLMVL
jgi:hypothetical protein